MRRILVSLALAVSIISPALSQERTTLTVVTINAWSGLTDSGFFSRGEFEAESARAYRTELLARELAALEPDIVTIGEANPVQAAAEQFANSLGMSAVSHMAEGGVRIGPVGLPTNLREGDIILAAEEAEPRRVIRRTLHGGWVGESASLQTSETTQVIGAELTVGGRSIYVFHTRWHESPFATREDLVGLVEAYRSGELASDELITRLERAVDGAERRLEEARGTVVAINEIAGDAPVILTGTLNALPGSEEIAVLENAGFIDAHAWIRGAQAAPTWDPARNSHISDHDLGVWEDGRSARIDYIFVRGAGLRVEDGEVVLDEPTYGVFPSSHFGVRARITLPEE